MSRPTRSCARCTRPALVTRAEAPYCLECNTMMDWSEVIAAVQSAVEPATPKGAGTIPAPPQDGIELEGAFAAPATASQLLDAVADPFSQRLS